MFSRRAFVVGGAMSAIQFASARAAPRRSRAGQHPKTYEDHLAARFRAGRAVFPSMILAHMAGYDARLPEWLEHACKECKLDPAELMDHFKRVLSGDPARIERSLLSTDRPDWLSGQNQHGAERIDQGLARVFAAPLALLGRGDVLVALHARSLDRLTPGKASALTVRAVTNLAEAGDWTSALAILERAARSSTNITVEPKQEHALWRYAYLHREVGRIMPVLARMPFTTDTPERVAAREWLLKMYKIRAGDTGVEVPVLAENDDNVYLMAAAMQVAALENEPGAEGRIKALQVMLSSKPTNKIAHDGVELRVNLGTTVLSQARAAVAARRKDYTRAMEHAKTRPRDGADPAYHMASAFLEEGDWQGAAAVAQAHDPRRRRSGTAEERAVEYVVLHRSIAVTAAWGGDDAAAAESFAKAQAEYSRLMEKDPGEFDGGHLEEHALALAGVAEGRLPRKRIHVQVDAFRA